jgi:hypothetical protein
MEGKKKNFRTEIERMKNELKTQFKQIPINKEIFVKAQKEVELLYDIVKEDKDITEWINKFENLQKEFIKEQNKLQEEAIKSQKKFQEKLGLGKKL